MIKTLIVPIIMLGLLGSVFSEENPREVQDLDTTLSWLNGIEADVDLGGWSGDYFFQYFIPQADGYINSIDFNFSDLPDIPGCGLSITLFYTDYPNWDEIETSAIADSCIDAQLGHYDEEDGFNIIGDNWVQGGINSVEGANPDFIYDPLDDQAWPAFGRGGMYVEPNDLDEGLVNFDLMHYVNNSSFQAHTPLAIVVQLFCQDSTVMNSTQTRMGFLSAQLDHDPQPCLKFFHPQANPHGNCGTDDWGWYIQSHVWDWRVNVTYTGPLGVDHPDSPAVNGLRPKLLSVSPNPVNSSTKVVYSLPQPTDLRFTIYDFLGRQIWSREIPAQSPGEHALSWDGRDQSGHDVESGLYIVTLLSTNWFESKKMVMLK
ncbi:MAG: T9SS type A sorting domain-containing protein [Candidatus Marinimicrobia bacterium]|nr:T9SS type A sorting domain-containing protein [Candidatus Neomarinimicrobiota bacterium]